MLPHARPGHRQLFVLLRHGLTGLTFATIFAKSLVCSGHWPEFRGPLGNGQVREATLPQTWSTTTNVRWRTPLLGEGWSSPVVDGDEIFLTAAVSAEDSPQRELRLLRLNAGSGHIQAETTLFRYDADDEKIHSKNSHASPTPILSGKRIFLHFGHRGTACTDRDGRVLWRNTDLSYKAVHGNGGSPVLADEKLIFSRDGKAISEITALHAATGQIAWRRERDAEAKKRFSFCTPLLLRDTTPQQVIIPGSNVVQSVDPRTGEELWRVRYEGYSVVPRPIFHSGLVFVCTGFDQASLLAIDPNGRGDVTTSHVRWRIDSNVPKTPSLVAIGDQIAMVSDRGIASCYEARSGTQVWTERVGGNHSASPLIAGNHMYLLDEKGVATILDVSGNPREVAVNRLGEATLASPAVVENDLLIRTDAALYRIGTR